MEPFIFCFKKCKYWDQGNNSVDKALNVQAGGPASDPRTIHKLSRCASHLSSQHSGGRERVYLDQAGWQVSCSRQVPGSVREIKEDVWYKFWGCIHMQACSCLFDTSVFIHIYLCTPHSHMPKLIFFLLKILFF